jgi:hypothetical protein
MSVADYDTVFRYEQALEPELLKRFATRYAALQNAILDCTNSGVSPESDPAVMLLAHHLGSLASQDELSLSRHRQACLSRVAELRRKSRLVVLAETGVNGNAAAKDAFHRDGRIAMRALADTLSLADEDYDLRSNRGGPAVSGEITLHAQEFYVQISLPNYAPGGSLLYRRCAGRADYCGAQNHYAPFKLLLSPARLAARLRADLALPKYGSKNLLAA